MSDNPISMQGPVCPLPINQRDTIVMGHGSGGRMTHELVKNLFLPYLTNPALLAGNDFAQVLLPPSAHPEGQIVTSTDCHIVSPLFFPGGDIGRLAVCGTVNDIAMSGALPLALTAGFILEEGLPLEVLKRVIASMQTAAQEAGVHVIAGDTKVVEKGKADQLFITTAGIGWVEPGRDIRGSNAQPGDAVILSGSIGDHGIAVLGARGDLGLQIQVQSDVCPLNHLIQALLTAAPHVHVLRDPTRGGLATTLNEIAVQSKVCIQIDEDSIPVNPVTRTACEMLGFDPLYIANEGKVIIIVPSAEADKALAALHDHPYGRGAVRIGTVLKEPVDRVLMKTSIGGTRILDVLAGEMLPRIC
jgi:hydrogenase expression/formation protein HypE